MRRKLLCVIVVAAACGEPPVDVETELAARRIALGLPESEATVADAMEEIEHRDLERLIEKTGLVKTPASEVLDGALRLENLLARASARDRPDDFRTLLADGRARARDLAAAAVRGDRAEIEATGRALLSSCASCHRKYREPH
jgi:hypothetical protein